MNAPMLNSAIATTFPSAFANPAAVSASIVAAITAPVTRVIAITATALTATVVSATAITTTALGACSLLVTVAPGSRCPRRALARLACVRLATRARRRHWRLQQRHVFLDPGHAIVELCGWERRVHGVQRGAQLRRRARALGSGAVLLAELAPERAKQRLQALPLCASSVAPQCGEEQGELGVDRREPLAPLDHVVDFRGHLRIRQLQTSIFIRHQPSWSCATDGAARGARRGRHAATPQCLAVALGGGTRSGCRAGRCGGIGRRVDGCADGCDGGDGCGGGLRREVGGGGDRAGCVVCEAAPERNGSLRRVCAIAPLEAPPPPRSAHARLHLAQAEPAVTQRPRMAKKRRHALADAPARVQRALVRHRLRQDIALLPQRLQRSQNCLQVLPRLVALGAEPWHQLARHGRFAQSLTRGFLNQRPRRPRRPTSLHFGHSCMDSLDLRHLGLYLLLAGRERLLALEVTGFDPLDLLEQLCIARLERLVLAHRHRLLIGLDNPVHQLILQPVELLGEPLVVRALPLGRLDRARHRGVYRLRRLQRARLGRGVPTTLEPRVLASQKALLSEQPLLALLALADLVLERDRVGARLLDLGEVGHERGGGGLPTAAHRGRVVDGAAQMRDRPRQHGLQRPRHRFVGNLKDSEALVELLIRRQRQR
mmetsp:Transcript_32408/g.71041  ORF Transcript_32408/g.71041 Transcript_32408/m.71041 type:complete len:658 (-) Transcript_32408:560-2533(-)